MGIRGPVAGRVGVELWVWRRMCGGRGAADVEVLGILGGGKLGEVSGERCRVLAGSNLERPILAE